MIRQPDGRWVKPNPAIGEKLENSITSLKVAIKRAEIISSLKDDIAWETVQLILRERLDRVQAKLKDFSKIDQRQVDILLQEEKDVEAFINIVDDFNGSVPGFESMIAQNEKELLARKPTGN